MEERYTEIWMNLGEQLTVTQSELVTELVLIDKKRSKRELLKIYIRICNNIQLSKEERFDMIEKLLKTSYNESYKNNK